MTANPNPPTVPLAHGSPQTAPHLSLDSHFNTPDGAVWGHADYKLVVPAHEKELFIPPPSGIQMLGDVESWVGFLKLHYRPGHVLLTADADKLSAVLDHHGEYGNGEGEPGRCQWFADHQFLPSNQWGQWVQMISYKRDQKSFIEAVDDLAEDITNPEAGKLQTIFRQLRTHTSHTAESELRPDGSAKISFTKDQQLVTEVEIPSELTIAIPILKANALTNRKYAIRVKIRLLIGERGAITFVLSFDQVRQWERAVADEVETAKGMLDEYNAESGLPALTLLRG